jgi:hypothetical protein
MNVAPYSGQSAAIELRQWFVVEQLAKRVAAMPEFLGVLLLGSFAAGTADPLSDVDLLLIVREGSFEAAWARRRDLYTEEPIFAWDVLREGMAEVGAHKWITREVVLVECLIATPSSGVRLAEPFVVLVGDPTLPKMLQHRAPIPRSELATDDRTPGSEIERRYDAFKLVVRSQLGRG